MTALSPAQSPPPVADPPLASWQGETMGTVYTVKIVGATFLPGQIEALRVQVDQRLKEINRQMSHYGRINYRPGRFSNTL